MVEVLSSSERLSTPLQREYADRDFNRPPFRYPTRDGSFAEHQPLYPQIDEQEIFEMEYRVFHPENFPEPPKHLPEGHPVRVAHTELFKAKNALDNSIREVRSVEPYLVNPEAIRATTRSVREKVGLEPADPSPERIALNLKTLSKRAREHHLGDKKKYFQKAIAYLYLYKHCPDVRKSPLAEDLLDETEAMYLAHMAYAVVRSAIHNIQAERKDGGLVIDHVYAASVHGVNRYMREIKTCNNPIQRRHLYHELKCDIIRSLCHDYLEDFLMLSPEFLVNKLIQHTLADTAIEVDTKKPSYEKQTTSADTTFCSKHRERIISELTALIKPRSKKRRLGYIQRQIFEELPEPYSIPTFLTKLADRQHNLKTLDTKNIPIERQQAIVTSTIEIIQTGLRAYDNQAHKNNRLRGVLLEESDVVTDTAIQEARRLLEIESTPAMIDTLRTLTSLKTQISIRRTPKHHPSH